MPKRQTLERTHLEPQQIVDCIGVSIDTVLGWIRDGKLRASNIASGMRPRWRIAKEDLQAFLDSRSNQTTTQTPARRGDKPKPSRQYV